MAKVSRVRRLKYRCGSDNKAQQYRMTSPCSHKIFKDMKKKKPSKLSEKKDWEDATCSVCMESPHNAVLLLCASYNKGCRPYMCATSYRFSNCLDQYKKAYIKENSGSNPPLALGKSEFSELLCPLCRGQVKGWTLVEPARKYLNKKKRTCMQENCSFVGNYKQLKKHVKADHPWARPREVDPSLEEKWKSLEREREYNDVISTLPPGTLVFGDYVLDPNFNPFYRDFDDLDDFLDGDFGTYGPNRIRGRGLAVQRAAGRSFDLYDDADEDDDEIEVGNEVPMSRHNRRMLFFGRPRRRWRRD